MHFSFMVYSWALANTVIKQISIKVEDSVESDENLQ